MSALPGMGTIKLHSMYLVAEKPQTIFEQAREEIALARHSLQLADYEGSILHTHKAMITVAKGWLLKNGLPCNTEEEIIRNFAHEYTDSEGVATYSYFQSTLVQIHEKPASKDFARQYFNKGQELFVDIVTS